MIKYIVKARSNWGYPRKWMQAFLLVCGGYSLSGHITWAAPEADLSPVQKYENGVECVGYYDFGLSMMPTSAPNRTKIQALREGWLNYAKEVKSTSESVLKMDISKSRKRTQSVAMSGDRQKIGTYMTAINSRCETLPLDPTAPSPSNPFGFEKNSDIKTYAAAMQCAGKYIVGEAEPQGGPKGTITEGFKAMARTAKPNINDKTFNEDLGTTTMKSLNILIKSDLPEFAALKSQCETAMPFLK